MSELKSELKKKNRVREKKVLNREDVYHGALEDILLGKAPHRSPWVSPTRRWC